MAGYGSVAIQGILGGLMGVGKAVASNAEDEMKAERKRVEDERLSKLRMGEYQQKQAMDAAAVEEQNKKRGEFYARTDAEAQAKFAKPDVTYTDTLGDEQTGEDAGGIIEKGRKASRKDTAAYRREEANKTGDLKLIEQSSKEDKEIRDEDEASRKVRLDEQKAKAAERLAAIKEIEVAVREKDADTRARRVDALISKALGGGDAGKEPAKIREVKLLADMAFDGDIQKAVSFAYGVQDKDPASATIQMANLIKDDPGYMGQGGKEKLMAKAKEMVAALKADGVSRGGVKTPASEKAAPPPKPSTGPVTPKSQAEFNALPKGSRYTNPADGKIYIKN